MYQIKTKQKLKCSLEELWDFISSPRNLQKITPEGMGFEITTPHLPEKMYPGMMISYKVSPFLGIKMTWITEITQVEDLHFFIDEQRFGPYRMWHHEHRLTPLEGGVLMEDLVSYLPPFGFLGRWANAILIRKKLKQIFDYREKVLERVFGSLDE